MEKTSGDLIYVTCPPSRTHLVAQETRKCGYGDIVYAHDGHVIAVRPYANRAVAERIANNIKEGRMPSQQQCVNCMMTPKHAELPCQKCRNRPHLNMVGITFSTLSSISCLSIGYVRESLLMGVFGFISGLIAAGFLIAWNMDRS